MSSHTGLLWWLDSPQGLAILFVSAFTIRVAIAPSVGFHYDLVLFRQWTGRLHDVGLERFYTGDLTYQYPPGYLYVLAGIGAITRSPSDLLLKLPSILGDLALAWVVGVFAVRVAPDALRERVPVRAIAIIGVLFNPAVIALSSGWGQVDVLPFLLVFSSLLVLVSGRASMPRELAALTLFAVAFSMKPQSAFVAPVVAYLLFRRHLYRRPWRSLVSGIARIALLGASVLVIWGLSGIPFGLGPSGLFEFYRRASDGYRLNTVQAFNLWGLFGFQRGDVPGTRHAVSVFGISAFNVGAFLFVLATAYVLWRAHRSINRGQSEARVALVAAALVTLSAFVLLTRMHERYMFPVLGFLAPLVIWRQFRYAYAALSVLFIANLWYPLTRYNESASVHPTLRLEPLFTWLFGDYLAVDTWQRKTWSALVVGMLVVLLVFGFRWVERIEDGSGPRSSIRWRVPRHTRRRTEGHEPDLEDCS